MGGRVIALLSMAAVLLVVAGGAVVLNLHRLRESFGWIEHTNQVLHQVATADAALLEAESGERGYVLTGDTSYLDSYRAARTNVEASLDALSENISDNEAQVQRLKELRALIASRLAEFNTMIELGPDRRDDILAELATARARKLTQLISQKLREMRKAEQALLAERQANLDRVELEISALAVAMTVLAVFSTAFGAFLLEKQRGVGQLQAANERLVASEASLKEREGYLEAILATVPDAMIGFDSAGTIRSFSATAERLFKLTASEAQGRPVVSLLPPVDRPAFEAALERHALAGSLAGADRAVRGQRTDGSLFPMEFSVGEVALDDSLQFVAFVRDLTERRAHEQRTHQLQMELLHISRLSSMGEMASALAHELNQPLTALASYLQGSRRLLQGSNDETSGTIRGALDKAIQQGMRAGDIIRRLRDFMARGETERRVESLSSLVREASALALLVTKDHGVRLDIDLDSTMDRVLVDKVQIQQVLLNLMRNGVEAMRDCDERRLTIASTPADGGMVAVSVADTGTGIASDVAGRLFEPFLTTKREGLGVGLSISRTIVESHGGRIEAEPRPGGGTVFRFTLRSATLPADADSSA